MLYEELICEQVLHTCLHLSISVEFSPLLLLRPNTKSKD